MREWEGKGREGRASWEGKERISEGEVEG